MLELLAPAGSMEALTAAVQNGADAVYLGFGDFNARRNAKNFTEADFAAAVSYCHLRDTKVYLTLNTLLTDRELPAAADLARRASDLGADAVLVQDLGVLRAVKQAAPDLPVHASTQMTVHNLDGVKLCADLGMTRAVLSRELSAEAIGYICDRSPIEIEVFGHGALCMCYSGQCFFSAVVGERSGNRGLCAQPCRMKYGWGGKPDGYPLSLKDSCMASRLRQIRKLGVTCLKLEGRMKRPEYVAVVTRIYSTLIKEDRMPSADELRDLELAFSREGFTQGYFDDKKGPQMFGVRDEKTPEPKELFAQARQSYAQENQRVDVRFYAMVRPGEPAQVGVEDKDGRVVTASGPVPEKAQNLPLTAEQVEKQLSRTGGTPYRCAGVKALVEPGLNLPLAVLNALRREVLEGLSQKRQELPKRRTGEYKPGVRYEDPVGAPRLTVAVRRASQLSSDLLNQTPAILYVPAQELAEHPHYIKNLSRETKLGVILPRIIWDREWEKNREYLEKARELGATEALVGNLGMARAARELGFTLRGDFGIPVFNAQSLKELKRLGFTSATASFELKLAQIRDLSKAIELEAIVYGRLPLMLTENCIIKNRTGACACEGENTLTDRKGERFPVVKAPGCRSEILNSRKLFLADKPEWKRCGLTYARLLFTTENPWECVQALERYRDGSTWSPSQFTRGLYYRGVE
ncbi:MAG: U32 family peptidase [Oscillospiraceae bacterium]|nr:U32 family peptidase [Oscillospiraceae bacterium]